MTQDVQPLTWSKRTNIEEHREFFSKINEIIANLAPTVDEAEAAIAQATQAIASANQAIATANAASAAADAAAQQAQTAAATVAGYDTRLTAVEGEADTNAGNITALQGRMGTAEGNITALQGVQADYVKKAGAAQTVTSQIMVPTTATGVRDTQIANGTRIQNDLDNYAPMLRTTGNQYEISGYKKFLNEPFAYFVSSQMKQFTEQTAFLELCNDGAYSTAVIFEFTESSGGGRAIGKFNITSSGVISETHSILVGGVNSAIGIVRYNGKVYLTLNGYGVFSNVYIRSGGNRRQNPIEIETPFSVADTVTYPDQLVITW